ncbi:YkvA family protein [Saccharopolyspora sp. SCSIO 74807]|uniref:YkvA family protein n=1 Tax=Saccharopolyspora sp. SCSIO 74807 TaxID=3118084 RepID=UPI0030CFEDA2
MLVVGVLLVVAGVITAVSGDWTGSQWLLPSGLIAAGIGVLIAGVVAAVRRRLAPLRAAKKAATSAPGSGGPISRARAVPAMVAAPWRGSGAAVPRYQTVLWLLALIYIVWPVDFVPDLLPLLGFTDDIGVGAWLLTSLYAEAGNHLARQGERSGDAVED